MNRDQPPYMVVLASMLAVAIACVVAITLGFWLRPHYSNTPDWLFGAILALILVGIAAGVVRLLGFRLLPARTHAREPARRPDPDMDPNKAWTGDGAGSRTGYELSFVDFRRLVTDGSCREVIAPLLREWYGYEITGQGDDTIVRSEQGLVVGLPLLHKLIQIDPTKQHTIYNRAMDLWR